MKHIDILEMSKFVSENFMHMDTTGSVHRGGVYYCLDCGCYQLDCYGWEHTEDCIVPVAEKYAEDI